MTGSAKSPTAQVGTQARVPLASVCPKVGVGKKGQLATQRLVELSA